jgi:prepilin-type processing-associated H-X9-DG protein
MPATTASSTNAARTPIQLTDGTSSTLLFAERNPGDPGLDSHTTAPWATPPEPPIQVMGAYCGWGSPIGKNAIVSVTFSGASSINLAFPKKYEEPPGGPVPLNWMEYKEDWAARLGAIGSAHPGLANAALADGSVRTLPSTFDVELLKALTTRAGGETAVLE